MGGADTQVEFRALETKVKELSQRYDREAATLGKLQQGCQERLKGALAKVRRTRSGHLTPDRVRQLLEDKKAREEADKEVQAAERLEKTFQQLSGLVAELAATEASYLEARAPGESEGIDQESWQRELRLRELRRIRKAADLARRHRHYRSEELHTGQMRLELLQELSAKISRASRRYLQPRKGRLEEQMGRLKEELQALGVDDDDPPGSAPVALEGKALAAHIRKLRAQADDLRGKVRKAERCLEPLETQHVRRKQEIVLAGQAGSGSSEKLQRKIQAKAEKLSKLKSRLRQVTQKCLQASELRHEQADQLNNALQELASEIEADISGARGREQLLGQRQAELGEQTSKLKRRAGEIEDGLDREESSVPARRPRRPRRRRPERSGFLKARGYLFVGGLGVIGIGSLIAWQLGAPGRKLFHWAEVAIILLVVLIAVLTMEFSWRR